MKITKITIKDFRAFVHEDTFDLDGGKNLLLYGENGSGKSSLFHALREFFGAGSSLSAGPIRDFRNVFRDGAAGSPTAGDGKVSLQLSDTNEHSWDHGSRRSRPTNRILADARLRSSFLEYRSLLKTNFDSETPRETLFKLAVKALFANVRTTEGDRISDLWNLMESLKGKRLYQHVKDDIAALTTKFNAGLGGILPSIEKHVALYLSAFENTGLKVTIRMPRVDFFGDTRRADRRYTNRSIGGRKALVLDVDVKLNEVPVPEWNEFLNEARLSALALSMYLAGVRESNAVTTDDVLRVLVLDDVLIGLDLSNRRPVLTILEKHFSDYQIFLLTHDRAWYDMASLAFADRGAWTRYELHRGRHLDFDIPVAHGKGATTAKNFTDRARHFLAPGTLDLRAAALYARVALEVKLKSYCDNKSIPTPYSMDGRSLDTEQLWKAVEGWLAGHGISGKSAFLMQEVKLFRRGVLNPMAHYHPVSLDQSEVEAAIKAVDALAFDPGNLDYLAKASQLLGSTAPSPHDIVDAACHLRTAFEVDLREFLKRMSGVVKYRTDWSSLGLLELWDAAKTIINPTNLTPAPSLILDIESERNLFLDDFDYATATSLSQAALQAAMNKLRDPAHHQPRTRLSTFV